MSFIDLCLTMFLAEIIHVADFFGGPVAALDAGETLRKLPRSSNAPPGSLIIILLLLVNSLPTGTAIPGRSYPRMSSLKYSIPKPPVPTKYPLKSPRGANLATRVWPVKKPKALCLIVHGGGWHSGYFDGLVGVLNKENIFCASYDQVNSGYSDAEPDSPKPGEVMHIRNFDCLVEDVCAAVDWMQKEAANTEAPVFLFGESLGGLQVIIVFGTLKSSQLLCIVIHNLLLLYR